MGRLSGGAAVVPYETLADPLDSSPRRALWVTSEVGTLHRACGTLDQCQALGIRHLNAGVATAYETTECCESDDVACAFDMTSDEEGDAVVILAHALARAEGRHIDPPYRCPVHGRMTFGGCCG